jgi:hypothetical protein
MNIKYRILRGYWNNKGYGQRVWWKLQKQKWYGWKTLAWTSLEERAKNWADIYKDIIFEFDKKTGEIK